MPRPTATCQTIAIHHVRPEHVPAFLAFMREVEVTVAGAPGLLEFSSFQDTQSGRLVGVGRWETPEAFTAAMPRIMALSGRRHPQWTDAPDELLVLTAPPMGASAAVAGR